MPDCGTCKKERRQSDIPFIVHEADMARMERTNKRLWVTNIILIAVILIGVVWFIWRESQYEDVVTTTQEVEQITDGSGDNNFIGGDYYGAAKSENNDNENP